MSTMHHVNWLKHPGRSRVLRDLHTFQTYYFSR